jgi:biopolymer transport protein ExbB
MHDMRQQGSVANAIKSALIKYQAVKKKVLIVKKLQRLSTKKSKLPLEMPMLQKNMTIISSLVSLGTLIGLLGTVSGIKAFGALAAAGTQIASTCSGILKHLLILQQVLNFSSSYYLLQLLYIKLMI